MVIDITNTDGPVVVVLLQGLCDLFTRLDLLSEVLDKAKSLRHLVGVEGLCKFYLIVLPKLVVCFKGCLKMAMLG